MDRAQAQQTSWQCRRCHVEAPGGLGGGFLDTHDSGGCGHEEVGVEDTHAVWAAGSDLGSSVRRGHMCAGQAHVCNRLIT